MMENDCAPEPERRQFPCSLEVFGKAAVMVSGGRLREAEFFSCEVGIIVFSAIGERG